MSSASESRLPEAPQPSRPSQLTLWPRSLFGRLFAAVLVGVLAAQAISVVLVTREREREYIQASVREWSRRILDRTVALQSLPLAIQAQARQRAGERPWRYPRLAQGQDQGPGLGQDLELGPPPATASGRPSAAPRGGPPPERSSFRQIIASPTQLPQFRQALERQLAFVLGTGYSVRVTPTTDPTRPATTLVRAGLAAFERGGQPYDVSVGLPGGQQLLFRIEQVQRGEPLPRALIMNLVLLALVIAVVLFLATRSITRPLSGIVRAAEAVGRNMSSSPLPEQGALELREAARAFNVMQERMQRYVGSRTAVLAAMSHDLKTPLTRLRLRAANLDDPDLAARVDADLSEMEAMVQGTLALLRGLNEEEPAEELDVNALLSTLQTEFAEVGAGFEVQGRAACAYSGRPQALKRCLTNLLSNAVKFGGGVRVMVEDGAQLVIRVLDSGPGIPAAQLQRVFEPFYRLESSRNRDTGGSGLGLSIARDIAQSHGGALELANLVPRGLAAVLTLPRAR